jgi:hypothetical protein
VDVSHGDLGARGDKPSEFALIVTNAQLPGVTRSLRPGESLKFGREQSGVGFMGERRTISRHHGTIEVEDDQYTVTSTGTEFGFVVMDRSTPSRVYVPRGLGPVAIPFASAVLAIEHRHERFMLLLEVVGSDHAERWRQAWTPGQRERWRARPAMNTDAPWRGFEWARSKESAYAWFKTLVALCEPALLSHSDAEHVSSPQPTPTNTVLAARLVTSTKVIERHIAEIYQELGLSHLARPDREIAVAIATGQGLVTPDDLHLLPPRGVS